MQYSFQVGAVVLFAFAFGLQTTSAIEEPTDPKSIRRIKGFQIDLVRGAKSGEDSWISMSFDQKGRVLLGLDSKGVARLNFEDPKNVTFERINNDLSHCRGVLYAHGFIYVDSTNGRKLVRLEDRDNDGSFESQTELMKFDYRSRYGHGSNQMRLGPDGFIYVVIGNDVSFPKDILGTSPYRNPQNDWLLPESRDNDQDNRVGFILRMDKDGNQREVIAGGFRNQVDMDFDPNGEMFTFDADMEWDIGAPWYRPIRINHIVSGGEYGWRWGTGKWPAYYPDSLPSNLDVGMGSPTGVVFGTRSQFPTKYQQALFLADWQHGRILVAHKSANGASYGFSYESFLDGAPLNVCDMEFGPDGNLYFITGGRGSQSALYRVSWQGKKVPRAKHLGLSVAQKRRRELEKCHRKPDPSVVEKVWQDLGADDPWIRHAARIALERQPVESWENIVLKEADIDIAMTGLVALARMKNTKSGKASTFQKTVISKLISLVDENEKATKRKLTTDQLILVTRICAILFARHGPCSQEIESELRTHFADMFPHADERVNCELLELLVYLKDRSAMDKALEYLMQKSTSRETQIHIVRSLSHFKQPWTEVQNRVILQWLNNARKFRGGNLLPKVVTQMQVDFIATLSFKQKFQLQTELDSLDLPVEPKKVFHDRDFVKSWSMADLKDADSKKGNRLNGRKVYVEAGCASCHRKGDVGGQTGPDLTAVGKRFNSVALLESIIEPSKQIDPKYALSTYSLVDGRTLTGRAHGVSASTIRLETDPVLQKIVTINRDDIEQAKTADLSPMPKSLLDYFSKSEIVDLLAYLKN